MIAVLFDTFRPVVDSKYQGLQRRSLWKFLTPGHARTLIFSVTVNGVVTAIWSSGRRGNLATDVEELEGRPAEPAEASCAAMRVVADLWFDHRRVLLAAADAAHAAGLP